MFLEYQERLREAVSILTEQDRMLTCLLEEQNLNRAENYGRRSESSVNLKGDPRTGKASDPSSTADGTGQKENKQKGKPKRRDGCIDNIMKDLPVHRRNLFLTRKELLEKYGTDQIEDPRSGAIFQPINASGFKFRKGSYLSAELLAYVLDQRFTVAVLYYRLEKWMARNHFYLKREILAAWVLQYDRELFAPLVCRLWYHLLLTDRIQIDETPPSSRRSDAGTILPPPVATCGISEPADSLTPCRKWASSISTSPVVRRFWKNACLASTGSFLLTGPESATTEQDISCAS